MPQFTFILCDPLESFGSLEDFGGVLRHGLAPMCAGDVPTDR
jgi:hypothetical protein